MYGYTSALYCGAGLGKIPWDTVGQPDILLTNTVAVHLKRNHTEYLATLSTFTMPSM